MRDAQGLREQNRAKIWVRWDFLGETELPVGWARATQTSGDASYDMDGAKRLTIRSCAYVRDTDTYTLLCLDLDTGGVDELCVLAVARLHTSAAHILSPHLRPGLRRTDRTDRLQPGTTRHVRTSGDRCTHIQLLGELRKHGADRELSWS
jgi:hypothetical protein